MTSCHLTVPVHHGLRSTTPSLPVQGQLMASQASLSHATTPTVAEHVEHARWPSYWNRTQDCDHLTWCHHGIKSNDHNPGSGFNINPTGTKRNNNVIMMSKRRRDIVLTWWHYCVVCPLGNIIFPRKGISVIKIRCLIFIMGITNLVNTFVLEQLHGCYHLCKLLAI